MIGVGYVPQIDDVFPPLSVKENLEIGGYLLSRREIPGRIDAVLDFFPKLKTMMTRKAGKLSGGERKDARDGSGLDVVALSVGARRTDGELGAHGGHAAARRVREGLRRLRFDRAARRTAREGGPSDLRLTYVLGGGKVVLAGAPKDLEQNPLFVESFLGGSAPSRSTSNE